MPNPPSQIFFPDPAQSVAALTASAAGSTPDSIQARMMLIKIAHDGNMEARNALVALTKVIPMNPDAKRKLTFRKPRKLTKRSNRQDRLTLRGEEKAVRSVDGRMLDIKDVLNKGGVAGMKKTPQYIVDAIQYRMDKAVKRVNPTTPGVKSIGPKQPTEKQLQREAARVQATEDAG
jgi:hypothetical protein